MKLSIDAIFKATFLGKKVNEATAVAVWQTETQQIQINAWQSPVKCETRFFVSQIIYKTKETKTFDAYSDEQALEIVNELLQRGWIK